MDIPSSFKYRAFLSYSHRDVGWAKWLHGRLEGFRFDTDLIGRKTSLGPVPKTLRPIFRDREDFSGGHTLTDATMEALDASAALIVLCSPVAASRPAVNEEVRLFRSRHPDRPAIPVIIDGSVPENFPPALRFELAADGSVTDRPMTILGPDLRDSADGKALGLAKTIGGLTGLSADDVFRRAERARRRQTRIWAGIAGFFLLLAVLASGSAVYAWQQLKTNEAFLSATLKTATDIVDTAVAQAEKYRVPRAATLELLAKAEGLFDDMAQYGRPTPDLRFRKAWMLIQFARNYAILGDTGKQFVRAREAHRLLAGLAADKPGDVMYQWRLSVADNEVGDVLKEQGRLDEALESFREGLAIVEPLAKAAPNVAGLQRDLSVSYSRVGVALWAQGHLDEALESFRESLAIMEPLAKADPKHPSWQRDLSVFYDETGGVLETQGHLAEALKSFRQGFANIEEVAKADPNNAGLQRDLSVSYEHVASVLRAQGHLAEALKYLRDSQAITERLANADPDNAVWQRDLAVCYGNVGTMLFVQGQLDAALKAYRDRLAIAERLAAADPGNSERQHDLAASYDRVGDVLKEQGHLDEALKSFRDGVAIMERLAKADPNNMDWKSDLALFEGDITSLEGQAQGLPRN